MQVYEWRSRPATSATAFPCMRNSIVFPSVFALADLLLGVLTEPKNGKREYPFGRVGHGILDSPSAAGQTPGDLRRGTDGCAARDRVTPS